MMTDPSEEAFPPLEYPDNWSWVLYNLPPSQRELNWRKIPLLGGFVGGWIHRHHHRKYCSALYDCVEEPINEILESRPQVNLWGDDPLRLQIVEMFIEVISLEKPITCEPPLHPDDPFPMLVWGVYDNMTPLTFGFEFENEFGSYRPVREAMDRFWDEQGSISDFINCCVDLVRNHTE